MRAEGRVMRSLVGTSLQPLWSRIASGSMLLCKGFNKTARSVQHTELIFSLRFRVGFGVLRMSTP
jgi:hypothetical protein